MILVIDNYDSFVYNLARYIEQYGKVCVVKRNDAITLDEIDQMNLEAIIISPGPCTPDEAGISKGVISRFGQNTPILGVCLGHQAIGEVYGGETVRAAKPIHGKSSMITHDGTGLFEGLTSPLQVGRYHSLIVSLSNESASNLALTAHSESDEIMSLNHQSHPVYGVQFHPESVLTPNGMAIIKNFLKIADQWNSQAGQ